MWAIPCRIIRLTSNPSLNNALALSKVITMTTGERRKGIRVDTPNLLAYLCLDKDKKRVFQGMGRTLNVSEGGILLETHVPIDPQHTVLLTIAMEEDLMHFKGKIIHSHSREDGRFESGIGFVELDEQKRRFLRQYILIFKGQEEAIPGAKDSSSEENGLF